MRLAWLLVLFGFTMLIDVGSQRFTDEGDFVYIKSDEICSGFLRTCDNMRFVHDLNRVCIDFIL